MPAGEDSLRRKVLEMRVARAIEERFSKEEILELYLNHIYFGGGAYGIEAASRHYFGHPAARLSVARMATLAALPKAPAHYDPREHPEAAKERRNLVLGLMVEQGRLGGQEAEAAKNTGLGVTASPPPRRRGAPRRGRVLRPGGAPGAGGALRRVDLHPTGAGGDDPGPGGPAGGGAAAPLGARAARRWRPAGR